MARWTMMLAAVTLMVGCGRTTSTAPAAGLKPLQPVTTLATTAGGEAQSEVAETEADRRSADPTRQRDGQGGLPR